MRDSQSEFATEIFGIRDSRTVWGRDDLTSRMMEDYLQVAGLGKRKKRGFKSLARKVVKTYKKVNPLFIAKRIVLDPLLKMAKGAGGRKKKGGGEEEYEEGADIQPSMPVEDRQGEETAPINEDPAPTSSSIEDRPGASEPPIEDRRGASEPPVEDRPGAGSEPVQENELVPDDTGESVEGFGGYMITGPVPMDVYDIEHKKGRAKQLSSSRRRTRKWEGGRLTYGATVPAGRTWNDALTSSGKRSRKWEKGNVVSASKTWESLLSGD
jgi:hypothetical protein